MEKLQEHKIKEVQTGSIAEELELEPGDIVLRVNGEKIQDIFDYQFLINDEEVVLLIRRGDGEEWELEIEKEYDEDLGIIFENSLMDDYKSCHNKCIFCFIDQMPPGMRETLYFKDDDTRLSFLQGNYVTLTNLKEKDLDRIIQYKLAPINISVQATNPELRCKMLSNRFAGDIMQKIEKLAKAEIPMNSQIVLCKGINDKEELDRSIRELGTFLPAMQSLSVVPIGITKYREHLYPVEPFGKEDAREVLQLIHRWQAYFLKEHGIRFVHASDEWFIKAGLPLPEEEYYEGYGQLENGVGMLRLFLTEFAQAWDAIEGDDRHREVSVATAVLAYDTIQGFAEQLMRKFPNLIVHVYCIQNDFFGNEITVTGLLTGCDLMAQLQKKPLGELLLLPGNVLKADGPVFLDDISIEELQRTLQVPVDIVKSNGQDFIEKVIGEKNE